MLDILQDKLLLDSFELTGVLVQINQSSRVNEAIRWASRSFGQSVCLIESFLPVDTHLNKGLNTELMNFRFDLGFSTIEKDLPAPV